MVSSVIERASQINSTNYKSMSFYIVLGKFGILKQVILLLYISKPTEEKISSTKYCEGQI